jgi:hypothetical protein
MKLLARSALLCVLALGLAPLSGCCECLQCASCLLGGPSFITSASRDVTSTPEAPSVARASHMAF